MKKFAFVSLLIGVFCLVGCGTNHGSRSGPSPGVFQEKSIRIHWENEEVGRKTIGPSYSNREVAELVGYLRFANYVDTTATITEGRYDSNGQFGVLVGPYRVQHSMAPGCFVSRVFDEQNRLIRGFSLDQNMMEEYSLNYPELPQYEKYPAVYSQGVDRTRMNAPSDCATGNSIFSWLGFSLDGPDMIGSMQNRILNGTRQPDQFEQGRECFVFRYEIDDYDGVFSQIVYVDKQNFTFLRWESQPPSGDCRIRRYTINIGDGIPEGMTFALNVGLESAPKVATTQAK